MPKKVKGQGLRCGFVKAIPFGCGMARCTEPKGHPFGEHKFGGSKKPAPGKPVELSREDWKHIAAIIGIHDASPGAVKLLNLIGWTGQHAATRGVSPAKG